MLSKLPVGKLMLLGLDKVVCVWVCVPKRQHLQPADPADVKPLWVKNRYPTFGLPS